MILRPRQQEFVDKSIRALEKYNNTVSVASTGAGKTICFSAVIKKLAQLKIQVVVLAHRDELTYQNQDKFLKVAPNITTSVVNADRKDWGGQVVFAMVQTLTRDEHLHNMPLVDLLVVDEVHHITADSYLKIVNYALKQNPKLKLFGVTATPIRGDKSSLGIVFDNCADQIELRELIASGHLVPPVTYRIDTGETKEKLEALKVKASGDYSEQEMADIMNTVPLNSSVVREWKDRASGRKTVVFCSNTTHAKEVTKEFRKQKVKVGLVTGNMPFKERQDILNDLTSGKIQVIVNVAILIEGWDYPPISCVILLRSSSYKSTMIQMIGRGLRTIDPSLYPNIVKLDCLVLDFGISTILHGNLEQAVDLDKKEEGHKRCPECKKPIPKNAEICPLCSADIEQEIARQQEAKEQRVLEHLTMREINLLEKLTFAWTDLKNSNEGMLAAGFNSWCCVFKNNDIWLAVGGDKNAKEQTIETKLVYKGGKLQALAAGNDFLYKHETHDSATKAGLWRTEKPTKKQRKWLPPEFKRDGKITRGDAGAILTFKIVAERKIRELEESLSVEK
jgi:superfamily II DNA or RNA helicase